MPVHHLASWRHTPPSGKRPSTISARRCSLATNERVMNERERGVPRASLHSPIIPITKSLIPGIYARRAATPRGRCPRPRARRPRLRRRRYSSGRRTIASAAHRSLPSTEPRRAQRTPAPSPSALLALLTSRPRPAGATSSPRSASSVSPPGDARPSPAGQPRRPRATFTNSGVDLISTFQHDATPPVPK